MALLNTPDINFDWQAPDFTLNDPSGVRHSMRDTMTDKGLMIAFLCNHCPYVQAITDRLATDFAQLQSEGIGVLAVMSNNYHISPCDAPEHMAQFAQTHGWTFPYLVDEDQAVGQEYGAVCTPDFFGFNGRGGLQYRGRLDDGGRTDTSDRNRELVDAMLQIAKTGDGPKAQTPSIGCSIKWG